MKIYDSETKKCLSSVTLFLTPDEAAAISSALAAPEPTHPGYVIGSHWLESAYSRICAGEAEANVLRDYGLIREEAFTIGVEHLRQENERLREALGKYGRHLDDCALTLGGYQCTCGFNQQEVPR